jgi:biopolymer transport protein ExbD
MPLVRLPADDPPEPSLAPMIDVVLVLTIFFMCATRFSQDERAFEVDLPQVASGETVAASRPEIVEVAADGSIRLRGAEVSIEALGERLTRTDAAEPNPTVLVRGDRAASHGRMAEVYEACRRAGMRNVGISVQVSAAADVRPDRRR